MKRIAFSSYDLPAGLDDHARFLQWREIYNDVIRPTDVTRFSDRPFSACYEVQPLKSTVIVRFRGTVSSVRWLSPRVIDNRDLHLSFDLGGRGRSLSQRGKDVTTAGDGVFMASNADLGSGELLPGTGALTVLLPSDQLSSAVPDVEDLVATRLNIGHPSMAYLKRYLQFLIQDDGIGDDPALIKHIDTTLVDLAVLALGAQRDAAEVASGRGLRAARLREVLIAIKKGFDDPAFSSEQVARAHGVTSRYVNDLLYETGKTLAERVLVFRLEKAHALLSNRGHDHLKISEIALSCGFNEVSYFNRCFRRHYGLSPTACRGRT